MIKVELTGLDTLRKQYSEGEVSKKVSSALQIAAVKTHKRLESVVSQTYFTPYELSKVFLGNSGVVKEGSSYSTELSYVNKATPLELFPNQLEKSTVVSRFIDPDTGRKVYGRFSRELKAKVKRSNGFNIPVKYGQKAFKVINAKRSSLENMIFVRMQRATWLNEPIDRAPIKRLYGLSLARMAKARVRDPATLAQLQTFLSNTLAQELKL